MVPRHGIFDYEYWDASEAEKKFVGKDQEEVVAEGE